MNDYEAKQEARRERLERAAERRQSDAAGRFTAARNAVAGIEFGQPILVGHHSEQRHRAAIRKSENAMRRGAELEAEARELAQRAAAVGTGGISSDDPDAVAKLEEKRAELTTQRDAMKRVNAYYRTHKTLDGCPESPDLIAHGLRTMQLCPYEKAPFPSYALSNIGARIRDTEQRIARLRAMPTEPVAPTATIGGATVEHDADGNRVVLRFAERLSKDAFQQVRRSGFVWAPSRNAFVRKFSPAALVIARHLAERLAASAPASAAGGC